MSIDVVLKSYSWVLTILALTVFLIARIGIPIFVNNWRKPIRNFIEREASDTEKDEAARRQAELIEKRENDLGFITEKVSVIEFLAFGFLAVLLFKEKNSALEILASFAVFLGGWLTLKVLSGHRPWSHEIAGKAYYHTSLIATLFNVAASFVAGFLFYVAWLQ